MNTTVAVSTIGCVVVAIWLFLFIRALMKQLMNTQALLFMTLFNDSVYNSQRQGMLSYMASARLKNERALWADFVGKMTTLSQEVEKSDAIKDAPRWLWAMSQEAQGKISN